MNILINDTQENKLIIKVIDCKKQSDQRMWKKIEKILKVKGYKFYYSSENGATYIIKDDTIFYVLATQDSHSQVRDKIFRQEVIECYISRYNNVIKSYKAHC
jgi:uncharacterized protein (UPF0297 family)